VAGEGTPLVHHPGAGGKRVSRRYPPGLGRVTQPGGEADEMLVLLAQPAEVPRVGRDFAISRHRRRTESRCGGDAEILQVPQHGRA
jgi:hypothetical protein